MQAYQLKIEMTELPTVWRRVIVPSKISFETLHCVIQYVMGWHDAHLYEFSTSDDPTCFTNDHEGVAEYEYYRENPDRAQDLWGEQALATPRTLGSAAKIDPILKRARMLDYIYDFGDNWQLGITLEEVVKDYPDSFPVCLAGGEPAPPEDVGGPHGYMDFLEVWHNPSHPEHADLVAWGKSQGFTGTFNLERVNQFLKWKLPLGKNILSEVGQELNQRLLLFEMPIAFNLELSDQKAGSTHFLKFYLDFLRILDERGPVKATQKGNLPAKLVKELFAQGYDYLYAPFRVESVQREADAWFLSDLHVLGRVSGLTIKRKGRIGLTKKGQKALELSAAENYLWLLRDYVFTFNMGYDEGYEPLPTFLIRYLIAMLSQYGSKERQVEFYAERLVGMYPLLISPHEPEERATEKFANRLFMRVMERFLAEFGLVETRSVRVQGRWRDEQFVRKTDLFDDIFMTW